MAPDSNTPSTAQSNSPTGPEGSRAASQAPLQSAPAPAQTASVEGTYYDANAPNASDERAALRPAAVPAYGPATAGLPLASSGIIGRTGGNSGAASTESASADDTPITGGNTASSGTLGPILAPQPALAPNQALAPKEASAPGPRSSSSAAFPSRSGNNASASIEGLPGDGSGIPTSAPAVAPSPAVAPAAGSELAGLGTDLSRKWWLWLLVLLATAVTWLCCCCCMGAALLLHRRSKRRIV